MGQPVVHFEIIGPDPDGLRRYYSALFGWEFDLTGLVSDAVSEPANYGFVNSPATNNGTGIPGGVGGGAAYATRVIFYVGVPNVEAALRQAESLGGVRMMGPAAAPGRALVVGHFTDPQGNLLGVAGPA